MSLVCVTGDCTTTTAVALAAAWPVSEPAVVVELDPRGGALAGWFDVPLSPSLSTLVASAHGTAAGGHTAVELDDLVRTGENGLSFVPAPLRSREAIRAVAEARRTVVPVLAAGGRVVIADVGAPFPGAAASDLVDGADVAVVCHRQDPASPGAASVRLERLREQVRSATEVAPEVVVALIGAQPFDAAQVADHVDPSLPWIELAVDPLAAATIAGREGISARRMRRLPLPRTAHRLADAVADALRTDEQVDAR